MITGTSDDSTDIVLKNYSRSSAPRYHGHRGVNLCCVIDTRGVKLCGVIDTEEFFS